MLLTLILAQSLQLTPPRLIETQHLYTAKEFDATVEKYAPETGCICTTTRVNPKTLKADVILVTDCSCEDDK
jgi:hypothetical protein